MSWMDKRAGSLSVGDVTPAGPIEEIERYDLGINGKVCLKINGEWFDRTRIDLVSVKTPDTKEVSP